MDPTTVRGDEEEEEEEKVRTTPRTINSQHRVFGLGLTAMCYLLNFEEIFWVNIVKVWLGLNGMISLDSALCNSCLRLRYLSRLHSYKIGIFVRIFSPLDAAKLEALLDRNIFLVGDLTLSTVRKDPRHFSTFWSLHSQDVLKSIDSIRVTCRNFDFMFQIVESVIAHENNVSKLFWTFVQPSAVVRINRSNNPTFDGINSNINTLHVTGWSENEYTTGIFKCLILACPQLTDIALIGCETKGVNTTFSYSVKSLLRLSNRSKDKHGSCDSLIQTICSKSHNLRKLTISDHIFDESEWRSLCTQCSPTLTDLTIDRLNVSPHPDNIFIGTPESKSVGYFPNLKYLSLRSCVSSSYSFLAASTASITELDFGCNVYFNTTALLKTLKMPYLKRLILTGCVVKHDDLRCFIGRRGLVYLGVSNMHLDFLCLFDNTPTPRDNVVVYNLTLETIAVTLLCTSTEVEDALVVQYVNMIHSLPALQTLLIDGCSEDQVNMLRLEIYARIEDCKVDFLFVENKVIRTFRALQQVV